MRTSRLFSAWAVVALGFAASAPGVELLQNGGLETTVSPPGWTQTETITGMPGTPISLSEQISFANSPNDPDVAGNGAFIKPWSGNSDSFAGQNLKINFTLSQTVVTSTPGTYNFTGDAFMALGYSGAADFLDPQSPSDPGGTGTVPSPTVTNFKIEFLNNSDTVLDSATLDLKPNTPVFGAWNTYTVSKAAPAGFTKVRVTAAATDMVDNFGGQDLYFDFFKLMRTGSVIQTLTNPDLNVPGAPANWTLTEAPAGTDNASVIGFAHHKTASAPNGQGLWVRAFAGGDMTLSQTVAAVAGGNYSFSAWTAWETGYCGDNGVFPGTTADSFLEMTFLDASSVAIGAPISLDLNAAGMTNDLDGGNIELDDWRQFSVNGVAPAGTASVQVAVKTTGMYDTGVNPQSAFFDDFSLQGPAPGIPGDMDGDNDVDGQDFLLIQRGLGTTTDAGDIADWRANFGTHPAVGAAGAVPEPATAFGATILAAIGLSYGRRRRAA